MTYKMQTEPNQEVAVLHSTPTFSLGYSRQALDSEVEIV